MSDYIDVIPDATLVGKTCLVAGTLIHQNGRLANVEPGRLRGLTSTVGARQDFDMLVKRVKLLRNPEYNKQVAALGKCCIDKLRSVLVKLGIFVVLEQTMC